MADHINSSTVTSEHFTLKRDVDAYGHCIALPGFSYMPVHLLQPFNDWAEKHFDMGKSEQNLLFLLEQAYAKGYQAAQADLRKALGIKDG